jgi:hypothetical protein
VPVSHGKSSYPKQSPSQNSNQTWQGKLMNYIQEKLQISAEALSNIDWESNSQAIRSVPIPNRTFLIKFLHRWLPVGKRVHQYIPSIYPSHCLSGVFPIEDFDHTFRCPSPQRRRWQINLHNDLFKTLSTFQDRPGSGEHRDRRTLLLVSSNPSNPAIYLSHI